MHFFYIHYVIIFGLLMVLLYFRRWIKPYGLNRLLFKWYVFNGECIISKMPRNLLITKTILTLLKKLNIDVNDKAIDALLYILIIYSFYGAGLY